jgi:hypothetical protein
MDLNEIDLEFMELEPEDRLTQHEALLLGLASDPDGSGRDADANTSLLEALD